MEMIISDKPTEYTMQMRIILDQINYVLVRVAGIKNEAQIQKYIDAIKHKYIEKFEFYGVEPGTHTAKFSFSIEINCDYDIDRCLPIIHSSTMSDDPSCEHIKPDIIMVAQKFLNRCKSEGLEIEWYFKYSPDGMIEAGNREFDPKKLSNDKIRFPNMDCFTEIDEINIKYEA